MRNGQFSYFYKVCAGIIMTVMLQVLVSCIADSTKNCPPEERLLYIRILDVLTSEDITATEDIENITLYLFNKDRELVKNMDVPLEDIRQGIPVVVTDLDVENGYAIVWANMDETVSLPEVTSGSRMADLNYTLLKDVLHNGFYGCPGDFFFGSELLDFPDCGSCNGKTEETVYIKRKNGKLHLTVRGLRGTEPMDNYYFRIHTRASGYTFDGIPITLDTYLREIGSMASNRDYLTPEPCMMIHSSVTEELSERNSLIIQFMQTDASQGDNMLMADGNEVSMIEVNRDINGDFIGIYSGKTTNVLMQLLTSGEVQVQVVLTDWNEIHQWSNW